MSVAKARARAKVRSWELGVGSGAKLWLGRTGRAIASSSTRSEAAKRMGASLLTFASVALASTPTTSASTSALEWRIALGSDEILCFRQPRSLSVGATCCKGLLSRKVVLLNRKVATLKWLDSGGMEHQCKFHTKESTGLCVMVEDFVLQAGGRWKRVSRINRFQQNTLASEIFCAGCVQQTRGQHFGSWLGAMLQNLPLGLSICGQSEN